MSILIHVNASEKEYNPAYIDSVLETTVTNTFLSESIEQISATGISKEPYWDIQSVKEKNTANSLYVVLPLVILMILLIKLFSKDFYSSILAGMLNVRFFQLNYKNKKYRSFISLLIQFFLKSLFLAFVSLYLISVYTKSAGYLDLKYFLWMSVFILALLTAVYAGEYIVQKTIGLGDFFKVYFLQYNLITTWSCLPIVLTVFVLYLNQIYLSFSILTAIVTVPLLLFSLIGLIRSLILLNKSLNNNLFYFFMYLCTFKIIPYLLILKLVFNLWG